MNKRSEAAAAVRPGPAAPSRLTILADSAVHRAGLVRRAGDATSFRLWIAARPALFVLAWRGDRSPIRGCPTTGRDRVPPRTQKLVKSPQTRHHLNTPPGMHPQAR